MKKITRVGDPTDNKDAVTKDYVDAQIQHEHDIALHAVGKYIVLPNEEDGTKTYFSVRAKKNVNLDNGKLVEVKNGQIFNARPTQIRVDESFDIVDNPGKDLKIMRFPNNLCNLGIYFSLPNSMSAPWNLSFSSIINNIASRLTFQDQAVQTQLNILWTVDGLTFNFHNAHGQIVYTKSVSGLSSTDFHHVSIEYVGDKLYFWVNGVQEIVYRAINLELVAIVLCGAEMRILSFYNRDLNKNEIVQHFIDYHVKNFTNDEILI